MKLTKSIAICIIASFTIMIGCKEDLEQVGVANYIPSNSNAVTGINTARLMEKADFEAIKKMDFYNRLVSEANKENSLIADVLMNPSNSGIDLSQKIYIANQVKNIDSIDAALQVFVPLSSVANLEKIMKEAGVAIESENGLKYYSPQPNFAMVWNDEVLTFTLNSKNDENILNKGFSIFENREEKTQISEQKGFSQAMDSEHDIVSWFSSTAIANDPAVRMASNFMDIDPEILQDNYIHSYADFENGKIVGHADFKVKRAFGRGLIGRLIQDESKTDFSQVLPTDGLSFAVSTSFNFNGIDRFLSERPLTKDKADFVLNNLSGLKRKELLETFSGDMMLASYSTELVNKEDILVALAFKNEKKAKEFFEEALANKKLKEIEKDYYKLISIGGDDFSITVNKGLAKLLYKDGLLLYSPNEDLLMQVKNGELGVNKEAQQIMKSFKGNSINGWVNFNKLSGSFSGASNEFIKDVKFNANGNGADFIIETMDKNSNSLKAIFEQINNDYITKNTEAM